MNRVGQMAIKAIAAVLFALTLYALAALPGVLTDADSIFSAHAKQELQK